MQTDLNTVSALSDHRLQVELADGRTGVFDVKLDLHPPALSALRDPACFGRVDILLGAATWPDGEDIAPSTMAAELKSLQAA